MTRYFDRMNIGFVTTLKYDTLSNGCLMLLFNYPHSAYEISVCIISTMFIQRKYFCLLLLTYSHSALSQIILQNPFLWGAFFFVTSLLNVLTPNNFISPKFH